MELIAALPLLLLPFFFPVIAGLMAKSFGRNFWTWFFIGAILPFLANIILLCLPVKKQEKQPILNEETDPVDNEAIFDHLVTEPDNNKTTENEIYFSASA